MHGRNVFHDKSIHMYIYMCVCACTCIYIYIYIYIYICTYELKLFTHAYIHAVRAWELGNMEYYCACMTGMCFELNDPIPTYSRVWSAGTLNPLADSTMFWEFYDVNDPGRVLQVLRCGGVHACMCVRMYVYGQLEL